MFHDNYEDDTLNVCEKIIVNSQMFLIVEKSGSRVVGDGGRGVIG